MKKFITFPVVVTTCFLQVACSSNVIYRTNNAPDAKSRSYFLPKGEVVLTIERKEDNAAIEIEATSNIIPDSTKSLYLHREHSIWYEDKYVVETDQYGLLNSINFTADFKGDEILKKTGELAAAATKLAIASMTAKKSDLCSTEKFKKIEIRIDPYVDSYDKINKTPALQDKCISVHYSNLDYPVKAQPIGSYDSILYRTLTNFPITVIFDNNKQKKTLILTLPNTSRIEQISLNRGYFVDRDTKLTFIKGILTKDESTYPSEALGFISLPLELVNGISNAITGRFDLRTKELQNETAYLQAQKSHNDALNSGAVK